MRINLYGTANVLPAEWAGQLSAPKDESTFSTTPQDTATLSPAAESVSALASQALQSSAGRSSKVEALRQQVQANTYALDPAAIADAIARNDI
jgi:flagellar biosynthesis anti-sigma factor FlgM